MDENNASNRSEQINAAYQEEIRRYTAAPVSPCSKAEAYRLLKKFYKKIFGDFWEEPVADYLPAVSYGIMKLSGTYRGHDEAVRYARELAESFDRRELARSYLYGVAHNIPAYTSALACYYYIKNLPEHEFHKCRIGRTAKGEIYNERCCEICQYHLETKAEAKMEFWDVNMDMAFFYLTGRVGFVFQLNTAIAYLEEYRRLEKPETSAGDLEHFMRIMRYIESLPEHTASAKLCGLLKKSGLLKLTMEQMEAFVDMLGYLNILHSPDSFGVTAGHTSEREMPPPLNERTHSAYPVNRWMKKYGVDHTAIHMLFDGIYGARLEANIIDMIKEEQLKLGYRSETIRLYYPLVSLNRLLKTELGAERMRAVLQEFCGAVEKTLGKIEISRQGERFCFRIPPQGADYVNAHMENAGFLRDFIQTVAGHGTTIEEIVQQFYRYSDRVHVEKISEGEFDYLIYFEDGTPDDYRYCITDEGGHMTYHRFTAEDYRDFLN